jgi:hypothetical protein
MRAQTEQRKTSKEILDIASAAYQAAFSPRHFRRIIEEDRIPVIQIGQKSFILQRDLDAWKATHGESRLRHAIQQVDEWMKGIVDSSIPIDRDAEQEDEL